MFENPANWLSFTLSILYNCSQFLLPFLGSGVFLGYGVNIPGCWVNILGFGVNILGFGVNILGFGVSILGCGVNSPISSLWRKFSGLHCGVNYFQGFFSAVVE